MNQIVNEISFKCSRGILENSDNQSGRWNYSSKLDTTLYNEALKIIYLGGNVIIKRIGISSLTFLDCSWLKDNCCQVFSLGFYVNFF